MVWLVCRTRPGLLVLSLGDSSIPVVAQGRGAFQLSTLSLSLLCPQELCGL